MGKKTAKVFGDIGNVATLGALGAATGIGGPNIAKGGGGKAPTPMPMRELAAEEKDLTPEEIKTRTGEAKGAVGLVAPAYLGLETAMSPLQKRTKIATGATSGDIGQDPEAFKYYRNLAFGSLNDPGSSVQPVERQYLNLFGEPTRTADTGGFLSAIERVYKRFL